MNRKAFDLKPGLKGFFITCFKNREAVTTKEAYTLLAEHFADESNSTEEDECIGDIEESLKREVEGMKNRKDKIFLAIRMHVVPCMIFIASKSSLMPSQMAEQIFAADRKPTRYIQRLIPVDVMCYANITDIQSSIKPMLDSVFNTNGTRPSFAVIVEQRMNSSLGKVGLIEMIAEMIGGRGYADLKQPNFVIMLQIVKNVVGIGIIKEYYQKQKMNLTK